MNYLLNKNIIFGIIIILVLTFVFGMLFNIIDAYAYDETAFIRLNSMDRTSDAWLKIENLVSSNTTFFIKSFSDGIQIYQRQSEFYYPFNYYTSLGSQYDNGVWEDDLKPYRDITYDAEENSFDAPEWFLVETGLVEHILFSQINNTISFKNSNVMGKDILIQHDGYTNPTGSTSTSIKFEIYDNNNNLVKVQTPDNISDSTVLNLPYTDGEYYYINVVNPTIYQPNFYTLYSGLEFQLPSIKLELGQAYKVISTDTTKSLTFANQLPDQVYIYKEYIDGTYDIFNHSPSGSITSLIESKDIIFMSTSSDVKETYFVIVDSIHYNHSVTTSSLDRTDLLKVDSIPYVPQGVSEMWENLETGIPGIGDVDFKIDLGVESMDTNKDELIYENKSDNYIDLIFETSGSNVVFVPQKKMLDENMQYYWTDISVNKLSSDKSYSIAPDRRVVVQVYQGTLNFKYPLEYISGSQYIDYVLGQDFVLTVKYNVHGNNPTAEDGTGLINNPNSDVSYTSPDDFNISDYFGDDSSSNIHIDNPYDSNITLPSIPDIFNSAKNLMVSAVNYLIGFNQVYAMLPSPFPQMVALVLGSLGLMLFIKILS